MARPMGWKLPCPRILWGGLSALKIIGVIVTHGVAMGWHGAGPLALKSAMSFSGIEGQFLVNSKGWNIASRLDRFGIYFWQTV